MLALLTDETFLTEFFTRFGYLAPFTVLVLAGFGLPIPEEVTMLGSGFLLYQERVEFVPIVLTCAAGSLVGDSVGYWIGRHWGRRALEVRFVRRIVHPERFRMIEQRFERNAGWAVFVCRFLPGIRLPAWFMAGALGMRYSRFLLVDALAALTMAPIYILLGKASGEKIAELEGKVEDLHLILGFVALALGAILISHILIERKSGARTAVRLPQDEVPAAGSEVSGPVLTPPEPEELADGERP